jgi:hypothetical protein
MLLSGAGHAALSEGVASSPIVQIKMSFAFKISDLGLVTKLAYSTVQNARRACGAHSALAREVNSLHVVLTRLVAEVVKPESVLNGGASSSENGDGRDEKSKELADLVRNCVRVLRVLKEILEKVSFLCRCLLVEGEVRLTFDLIVQCTIRREAKCAETLAEGQIREWRDARPG